MTSFAESTAEQAALGWLDELGYKIFYGNEIAPGEEHAEREKYDEVVLVGRLREALTRINPTLPAEVLEEAIARVLRAESPNLIERNYRFHKMLTEGITVERRGEDGRIIPEIVWLVDFNHPEKNDWIAVNQFTIIEGHTNRRPDIIIFINGLPLAVVEMKNPADEGATIQTAYHQFQTYKTEIPSIFPYNELLIISDGLEARAGTLTADWSRFMPWRTVDGVELAPKGMPELEVLIKGIFDKSHFLDLLRYFVVFETDGARVIKKIAAYHQYHAVNKAVTSTVQASSAKGDRRVGVVWHTQGSGKSLTMAFYVGKIVQHSGMENPTVIVLTDRNDLDDQLFETFSTCKDLLRQTPVQAENRAHLKDLLKVGSGGVVFTTIQKFAPSNGDREHPLLSERRNIVFVADEAHRSQYDFIDGFARHMRDALPNASFIGFTGTPIEAADKNTKAVFGEYVDVYDIHRAVEDGATVKIYYEGRLAKIGLREDMKPKIDAEFEDVTEGEESGSKEKLKSKWARMEALVGAQDRIDLIAADLVRHFEERLEAMDGKAMIVCMSRRICVELYRAIAKLRPNWHDESDDRGFMKVIMTGSASDTLEWQQHIRNKSRRKALAERFKDPENSLKIVIVRDMWLTGFDAPCMHTMYIDKPMRGHGLMQAIARVNRVFKDKPGGLVVDYLGIADQLKRALADYTVTDQEETAIPQEKAVALFMEKYEVVKAMFHGFNYTTFFSKKAADQIRAVSSGAEYILGRQEGKERLLKEVSALSRAFALAVPHEKVMGLRDDVGFFQAIRAALAKSKPVQGKTEDELDSAVRQIISSAVASDKVVDIFAATGLKHPDVSIFSEEFLAEVQDLPQRNLAVEMLRRLLTDEIKAQSRRNVVQARLFSDMLEQAIRRYQNRSLEAAQVLVELIALAKDMQVAQKRGEDLGLTDDEVAFYDALAANESAVEVLGDKTLRDIARELVEAVKKNVTIDWTMKESVRAKLRTIVKRLLRKYGYPPDLQEKATQIVLEQAEVIAKDWA